VHVELIDPDSGQSLPWEDGARGEPVYTALQREAMPLLRFRIRDHVVVTVRSNTTGMQERIASAIRARLLVTAEVELVAYGSLPRDEYKATLVDYSCAE